MTDKTKLGLLEHRLQILNSRECDNRGACRRLTREIRNLKARIQNQQGEQETEESFEE